MVEVIGSTPIFSTQKAESPFKSFGRAFVFWWLWSEGSGASLYFGAITLIQIRLWYSIPKSRKPFRNNAEGLSLFGVLKRRRIATSASWHINPGLVRIFCLMYFVYILYSRSADRYYVGQTENVESRLESHGSGISPYTSHAKDWRLVYTEEFAIRQEAIRRENEIKRKKSRRYIEWLIGQKAEGD